jgi:hypothetical protein
MNDVADGAVNVASIARRGLYACRRAAGLVVELLGGVGGGGEVDAGVSGQG